MAGKQTDWEAIEKAYRAGLLSVREIAGAHGISHVAIQKRAKRDDWSRDLNAKIRAKADALVTKSTVTTPVTREQVETERGIVDANARVIADIRMAHRGDITRAREMTNRLLDELSELTENRALFDQLGELMANPDDRGVDKLNDLYHKVISMPGRTKSMKELSETLRTLIGLERQAYGMDVAPDDFTAPAGLGHFYGESGAADA